jgi:competence protein ComEC
VRLESRYSRLLETPVGRNDNSIGLIVEYGSFRMSLAGDAEQREWAWWLVSHSNLLRPVQVHKASHHGSRNGDSSEAINRLAPKAVIVSVGAGNGYGHPHPEALLLYTNASVHRTDLYGTIVVEADPSGRFTVRTGQGEAPRPPPAVAVTPTASVASDPASGCIDLNTASAGALRAIVHIGEVRAQEIVRLRRIQPFRSVQDLMRVSGIGSARLRDIVAEGKACVRSALPP